MFVAIQLIIQMYI